MLPSQQFVHLCVMVASSSLLGQYITMQHVIQQVPTCRLPSDHGVGLPLLLCGAVFVIIRMSASRQFCPNTVGCGSGVSAAASLDPGTFCGAHVSCQVLGLACCCAPKVAYWWQHAELAEVVLRRWVVSQGGSEGRLVASCVMRWSLSFTYPEVRGCCTIMSCCLALVSWCSLWLLCWSTNAAWM